MCTHTHTIYNTHHTQMPRTASTNTHTHTHTNVQRSLHTDAENGKYRVWAAGLEEQLTTELVKNCGGDVKKCTDQVVVTVLKVCVCVLGMHDGARAE